LIYNFLKVCVVIVTLILISSLFSCNDEDEIAVNEMLPTLSQYKIYEGVLSELKPSSDYKPYELSSTLFTDYAEKQRLVKVPNGSKLIVKNDGLVDFPNGAILVKTFYYYHDKRDTSKGKKIIETRLLIKKSDTWKVGTFKWNKEQTEAYLITSGDFETVNWIDDIGTPNVISYRIPSNTDCKTCHRSNDEVIPIGPKVRNLNISVVKNGVNINQLTYLAKEGVMNEVNTQQYSVLPNYHDGTISDEKRARAYLEINCAHCHSDNGFAGNRRPRFSYEYSLQSTNIPRLGPTIIRRMGNGQMPKLGTTVLDKEGVELIKKYIDGL
jgi:uncharacterized repeat protein (TIGR03806 family)